MILGLESRTSLIASVRMCAARAEESKDTWPKGLIKRWRDLISFGENGALPTCDMASGGRCSVP